METKDTSVMIAPNRHGIALVPLDEQTSGGEEATLEEPTGVATSGILKQKKMAAPNTMTLSQSPMIIR